MGRPPVPPHLKRDKRLVVMLTDEEAEKLASIAHRKDMPSLSDWVRDTLIAGEATEIERNAWRFWFNEFSFHLATGTVLTADRVQKTIDDLRNMDVKPYTFVAKMKPSEMEDFATRCFPIYEAVGNNILARVMSLDKGR